MLVGGQRMPSKSQNNMQARQGTFHQVQRSPLLPLRPQYLKPAINNPASSLESKSVSPIDPPILLTLRLILHREEVMYLFGADVVLIEQLQEQSGATIILTPAISMEQILSIRGSLEIIFKAFSLVCRKLWDFVQQVICVKQQRQQLLVLKLAVPAALCGAIMGKRGQKVNEICALTHAYVRVHSELLPDSTERCIEITGNGESCLQCTYHICTTIQDSMAIRHPNVRPEKTYLPKGGATEIKTSVDDRTSGWKPIFLCGDRAFVIEGDVARRLDIDVLKNELAKTPLGPEALTGKVSLGPAYAGVTTTPLALMTLVLNNQDNPGPFRTTDIEVDQSLLAPTLLEEVQRTSRASVISAPIPNRFGTSFRKITISGSNESVVLAEYMIRINNDMASNYAMKDNLVHDNNINFQAEGSQNEHLNGNVSRQFHMNAQSFGHGSLTNPGEGAPFLLRGGGRR